MANELNTEVLNVALKSMDEFAQRELPDSLPAAASRVNAPMSLTA